MNTIKGFSKALTNAFTSDSSDIKRQRISFVPSLSLYFIFVIICGTKVCLFTLAEAANFTLPFIFLVNLRSFFFLLFFCTKLYLKKKRIQKIKIYIYLNHEVYSCVKKSPRKSKKKRTSILSYN